MLPTIVDSLFIFLYYPMLLHGNNKEKFNKEYN